MEAIAKQKNIRVSPRKLRLVADLARGKQIQRAIDDVRFCAAATAKDVVKLLRSALNNAMQNRGVDVDALYVKTIMVDQAPTFKRFMTRARGSSSQILKRNSHLTIILDERQAAEAKKKSAKGAAVKKSAKATKAKSTKKDAAAAE